MKSKSNSPEKDNSPGMKKRLSLEWNLEFCDCSIAMYPNDSNAHYNKAEALRKLAEFDNSYLEQVLPSYDKAIELNPDNALALCDRGKFFAKHGKGDLALKDIIKAGDLLQGEKNVLALYVKNTLKDLDVFNNVDKEIVEKLQSLANVGQQAKSAVSDFEKIARDLIKEVTVQKMQAQLKIEELGEQLKKAEGRHVAEMKDLLQSNKAELAKLEGLSNGIISNQKLLSEKVAKGEIDINSLHKITDATRAEMEGISNRVANIEKAIEVFQQKVDEHADDIKDLVDHSVHSESATKSLQKSLLRLMKTTAEDSKFSKEQISAMQAKFDIEISKVLSDAISSKQDTQKTTDEIKAMMKDISKTVQEHTEGMAGFVEQIGLFGVRLDSIEGQTKQLAELAAKNEATVAGVKKMLLGTIKLQKGDAEKVQQQIEQIVSEVNEGRVNGEKVQELLTSINGKVAIHEKSIAVQGKVLAGVKNDVEMLKTTLTKNVEDLNKFIDEELEVKKVERLEIEKQFAELKITIDQSKLDSGQMELVVGEIQNLKTMGKAMGTGLKNLNNKVGQMATKMPEETKMNCVTEITYDNPSIDLISKNPELLKYLHNQLGAKIINLLPDVDHELIKESLANDDYDIALAGLISLSLYDAA